MPQYMVQTHRGEFFKDFFFGFFVQSLFLGGKVERNLLIN